MWSLFGRRQFAFAFKVDVLADILKEALAKFALEQMKKAVDFRPGGAFLAIDGELAMIVSQY